MNETLLTYVVVFAELGGILLLVAFGGGIYFLLKSKKEGGTTKNMISYIKNMTTTNRDDLAGKLKEKFGDDSEINIDALIEDERQLYQDLIKFSINKDTSLLQTTTSEIHSLVENYVQLLATTADIDSDESDSLNEEDGASNSKKVTIKKENEALRIEMASLENRLQNATDTIENMMGEFSSMYEGGSKEGEQKVKNEMYKLKQQQDQEEAQFKADLKKIKD